MGLPENLRTGLTARLPGDWKQQPTAARGRTAHTPGCMNKRETAYSLELEARLRAGEIVYWRYEPIRLKLAERTTYTPDFLVQLADGALEFHEVKGHREDDWAVKHKVAIEQYPMFQFLEVKP